MLKVYYSSNKENIKWKIYTEYVNKSVFYFPIQTNSQNVLMQLSQINLFENNYDKKVNVIDISDWKLSNKQTQNDIEELAKIDNEIVLIIESSTFKSKLFDKINIKPVKILNINRKNKSQLVVYLLNKYGIKLDFVTIEKFLDLLPNNVHFIENEIKKIKLIGKTNLTFDEIQSIMFDTGESTVFKLIDAWLSNDAEKTIHQLNNLLLTGYFNVLDVIPIFVYKLVQIKFFLHAKICKWSSDMIASKLSIPLWLQRSYLNLKPYTNKLLKINDIISKLYNFDINIKKKNINKKDSFAVPYSQLIKILLD